MTARPAVRRVGIALALAAASIASACAALPWAGGDGALTASGTLEADEVVVAPRITGQILDLPKAAGDPVRQGEVLARIDDRAAQLQLRQAPDSASRETAQLLAQDYTLRAPIAGVVTRVPAHVGELAMPGQVLLAMSDLSSLDLTLYVRLADLAQVSVGQRVVVTTDVHAGRTFEGVVTAINQEAEFTPRNVQTRTDRLNLVFGVQARVANPDGALKPGMPAEARFQAGAQP